MASATETFRERARVDHGCENCRGRNQRIATQLERMRTRTRVTTRGTTAEIRSGQAGIEIFPISVPDQVAVGGERLVRIGIRVAETVPAIGTDPDVCVAEGFTNGLAVEIDVDVDGNQPIGGEQRCIPDNGGEREVSFSIAGGSPGTVDVDVSVRGQGSGNSLGQRTFGIEIVEETDDDGQADVPTDDDGNGNGNGDGPLSGPILPCFLDPNRSCTGPESVAWAGAGTLLVVTLIGR